MAMISQLGRYEIISEIGQGAMGVVYKATDPLIDRTVAIKTINLGLAQEEKEEYEGRFYQEAKAAGRLSHPNIVTIYDVGKSGEVAYIAMEFLQGRELRDVLNDEQVLPVAQVLNVVLQVALGLAYAHEHGIVHRDVKPSNIMVIRDGHVKITDFGIARMESASVRTQTGMVLGSPKYMSPEQVMGKLIDQRSDIFSLGVMLYEMLTSKAPFVGENVNAIMYQTLNGIPPPPSTVNSAVPDMLNFIVAKALAKNLDDRYQNAKDFADDLRACRDALPRASAAAGTPTPASPSKVLPDATPVVPRVEESEASSTVPTLGLSTAFDSFGATMRLAAMTATPADVEELSKTFKMARPSMEDINRAAPKPQPSKPSVPSPADSKPTPPRKSLPDKAKATPSKGGNNGLLITIVVLVIIGLIFALLS
ncbi:MAG: serine/threonine protein kinase [Gallionellaceae bacterium]|nr:MAG: serine/threonine protein kinase [Gallionellaceae bacterium]